MARRPTLAVSLPLTGRRALVVGTGPACDERASRLRAAGAEVELVAADDYRTDMCGDVFLVVAQTGDPARDRRVAEDARAAGTLAYAHDQPAVSDFAFPAEVRRGPLTIAVSTDGVAPALARRVREELERLVTEVGPALDELIDDMAREREARSPGDERARALYQLACRLHLAGRIEID